MSRGVSLGGIYLYYRGYIDLRITSSYIVTSALMAVLIGIDPLLTILSGGLLFGAIFMATDMVTSPVSKEGRIIYGIGCGILTVIIREFTSFPEGITFAILLMNGASYLIDVLTEGPKFGQVEERKRRIKKLLPLVGGSILFVLLILGSNSYQENLTAVFGDKIFKETAFSFFPRAEKIEEEIISDSRLWKIYDSSKGHKGYGRKISNGLPIDEITIKIPEDQMYCPRCGAHYQLINSYEESHDIEQFFSVAHRILKREKARKTCDCEDVSPIITAPVYPKIIPQSIYSTETWIQFLTEKYFLQVLLNRQMRRAIMFGHQPCAGTVTGGLKKFLTVRRPIYKRLMEESRKADHWHVDETGWKMFVYVDDKENYRWWLWVFYAPQKGITLFMS